MPIELTRRDVVKAGLVTAAGTIPHLTGCASRSESPGPVHDPEIDRVLVLSDTHIAADPGTLSRDGVNMSDRLNQVVERTRQQDRRWIGSPPGRPMADWMEETPEFKGWRLRNDFSFGLINGDAAYDVGVEDDYRTLQAGLENLDGLALLQPFEIKRSSGCGRRL